jgi:hypothetical protein
MSRAKRFRISATAMTSLAAVLLVSLPAHAGAASLSSGFDAGAEDWSLGGTGAPGSLAWAPSGGADGGGYIGATDETAQGADWYFVASSWNGDLRANYGGEIGFSQQYSGSDGAFTAIAIANPQLDSLEAFFTPPPGPTWESFSATVKEDDPVGWLFCPANQLCRSATQADFLGVLDDVSFVAVLGDVTPYAATVTPGAVTDLDEVFLSEPAIPPDGDADGAPDISDGCPTQAAPSADGCPASSPAPPASAPGDPCAKAKWKLKKAKKKLKELKRADASDQKVKKAKKRVEKAKNTKKQACATARPFVLAP